MRIKLILLCLSLAACAAQPATSSTASHLTAGINVRDYGATGDGVTDDRAAIQQALAAGYGSTVVFPAGRYLVGRAPQGAWSLMLPAAAAGTTLVGEDGTVMVQAAAMPGSVRMFYVNAPNVTIRNFELDGNRAAQSVDEHRHGVFASGATGLRLSDLSAHDFTGDGVYLYEGSNGVSLTRLTLTRNGRNGLTFGGKTSMAAVTDSLFSGNKAQQVDSEPAAAQTVDDVEISGCVMDGDGVSGDYVLTISGSSSAGVVAQSARWTVHDNTINGPTYVVWAKDSTIANNHGVNATAKSTVTVYRWSDNIRVTSNQWTASASPALVDVFGTALGDQPDHVLIDHNTLAIGNGQAHGVHVLNALGVEVSDNNLTGAGIAAPYYAGVLARSALAGGTLRYLVVQRNRIGNFGQTGVITAASPGAIGNINVSANVLFDTAGVMTSGLAFDDGADIRQYDNVTLGGVTTLVLRPGIGTHMAWGNGDRWVH